MANSQDDAVSFHALKDTLRSVREFNPLYSTINLFSLVEKTAKFVLITNLTWRGNE